jgi:hypothetical protein
VKTFIDSVVNKFFATIFLKKNISTFEKLETLPIIWLISTFNTVNVKHIAFHTVNPRKYDSGPNLLSRPRLQSTDSGTTNNTHFIRDHLLQVSALLVSKINELLVSKLLSFDGASSDDFRCPTGCYLLSVTQILCPKQTNKQAVSNLLEMSVKNTRKIGYDSLFRERNDSGRQIWIANLRKVLNMYWKRAFCGFCSSERILCVTRSDHTLQNTDELILRSVNNHFNFVEIGEVNALLKWIWSLARVCGWHLRRWRSICPIVPYCAYGCFDGFTVKWEQK